MRGIGPLAVACAALIVLIAPVALALGFQLVFVGAAALCLLLSIAACTIIIVRRKDLGLSAGQVASTVFVAIICLPCAPNVLRSMARRRHWRLNARDLPEIGFDASRLPEMKERVRQALTNAQRFVSEDGKERAVIEAQLRALGGPAP
jgi:hypothetical protein